MKRVALTGGTGFVGANLARRLLGDGHEVHLLLRPGHTPWRIRDILNDVRQHVMDLTDVRSLSETIKQISPEWVFHLATHGAYPWQTDIEQIVRTNIIGTINVVEACLEAGCGRIIHTGSSSEYGFKDHAPAETERLEPNSVYAVAKASATLYCRYIAERRDAHITTLRLYSVFGPYENPERLVPTLIRCGLRREWPPLADPETARDFVYVEDVCDACLLAAQVSTSEHGAVYNVGTGRQTTLRDATNLAKRVFKVEPEPRWRTLPARSWDTAVWQADNHKIVEELGWRPRHSFEEGFLKTVAWEQGRSLADD